MSASSSARLFSVRLTGKPGVSTKQRATYGLWSRIMHPPGDSDTPELSMVEGR